MHANGAAYTAAAAAGKGRGRAARRDFRAGWWPSCGDLPRPPDTRHNGPMKGNPWRGAAGLAGVTAIAAAAAIPPVGAGQMAGPDATWFAAARSLAAREGAGWPLSGWPRSGGSSPAAAADRAPVCAGGLELADDDCALAGGSGVVPARLALDAALAPPEAVDRAAAAAGRAGLAIAPMQWPYWAYWTPVKTVSVEIADELAISDDRVDDAAGRADRLFKAAVPGLAVMALAISAALVTAYWRRHRRMAELRRIRQSFGRSHRHRRPRKSSLNEGDFRSG
jgi:hypothetical protein